LKAFVISNPTKLASVLELLAPARDPKNAYRVKLLAGGQDLFTEMKEHLVEPERLVNLKSIPGLDVVGIQGDTIALNPLVTLERLETQRHINERAVVLSEAAHSVASPQIRSVGTVGGNLNQRPRCLYYRLEEARCLKKGGDVCFSAEGHNRYNAILGGGPSYIVHPSDLAPALIALDAQVHVASVARGLRSMPLEKYYTLPKNSDVTRETVLEPDEILTAVTFDLLPAGARSTYVKFKEKESYDFALAAVALRLDFDGTTVRKARLVLGGVAPIPWRVPAAEAALEGQTFAGGKVDEALAAKVCDLALAGAVPMSDNAFKIPLTKALVLEALTKLARA